MMNLFSKQINGNNLGKNRHDSKKFLIRIQNLNLSEENNKLS